MVVIRLARFGKKHSPRFRVTVADHRRWLGGKCIEVIGHYNPAAKEGEIGFTCDMEKVKTWIGKGAQPSERVYSLIRKTNPELVPKTLIKKPSTKTAAKAATKAT